MSSVMFKFENGDEVRCKVTGLEGTIIDRVDFINGCIQYGVQPKVKKGEEHKVPDSRHIDEKQLEYKDEKRNRVVVERKPTGGDMDFDVSNDLKL